METLLLKDEEISQAAAFLRKGELVAFPTETVYGLGAPVYSPEAIEKIYTVKRRPQDNPLIAHVGSLLDAEKLSQQLPPTFFRLAEAFFPGPLTLVVKRNPKVPSIVSAGLDTIALRQPSHPLASRLIAEMGQPLVAPSANLSGRPSSTKAEHVLSDFNGKIAAVLDGGPCLHGMESTVIDLVSFDRPTILRLGALKKEAIEGILGLDVATYTRGPRTSPGMKYRHYAPDIPVTVYSDRVEYESRVANQERAYAFEASDPSALYASLRFAEDEGYDEVIIYRPESADEALLSRLEKITSESHPS
ncbi:MAG: L-threonylcarbamoyladenylate synthase [Simkaniaceae bacterium]|nr:L-threonylcarbamoyladenylate synthase [Candidatus Sacchlamyda saccharinae]